MKKKYVKPSSMVFPLSLQSVMAGNSEPPDGQQTPSPKLGNSLQTGTGSSGMMESVTGASAGTSTGDKPDSWE